MAITSTDTIKANLLQGYDPQWYASLYRQMCYSFGDDWNKIKSVRGEHGTFPDFPEITVKYMEVGRSRRILNSAFIGLSRTMGNDPSPEFPQLDKFTAEVRKQWYMSRYAGSMYEGEWAQVHADAFMDGDGLGVGFVQFGLKSNPKTQFQYVTCEYSPAVLTLYDRHERTPDRARWMAFAKYLSVDQAAAMLGWKKAKEHSRPLNDGDQTYPLEVVRVFDYYDIGIGPKGTPTRALICGDLANAPITVTENDFECIPQSHMLYFMAPGMKRPTGRIVMQMSTQEGLNEIERFLRKALKNPGFNIIDVTQFDKRDVARLNAGETNVNLRLTTPRPGVPPFYRVEGAEVAQTILYLRDMYERQFNTDSGTSDLERGNQLTQTKTLGEAQLLDQRSQTQSSWSDIQALKMHRRSVEMAVHIGEKFDRDPLLLDIFGDNILFNDPAVPSTYMNNWLAEPSKAMIAADSIRARDNQMDLALRRRTIVELGDLVQMGLISPQKFAEERLRASGFNDPGEWAPEQAPATELPSMVGGL